MTRLGLVVLLVLAAPPAKPPPAKPATPRVYPSGSHEARSYVPPVVQPLPVLPSIARVKVTTAGGTIAVVEEVNLSRGDWKGETLRFHVAFGAPGPRAVDAHLVPVEDGALEPDDAVAGEPLPLEHVARRPPSAYALLGRDAMAGIVVTVKPDVMAKALASGNMATLRIRSVADATVDATGAASAVVRLGSARGTPLTLGRIQTGPATRAEAHLCGPEADPHPLAVTVPNKPRIPDAIAPVLSTRHASDDLCVSVWP